MLDVSALPPVRLAHAIRQIEAAGRGWHAPLYRAVLAREIALAILAPGERAPMRLLDAARARGPQVIILAGDDGRMAGPDAFPQAHRLLRWARFILLHGAAGAALHYDFAVGMAGQHGRLLLIETSSAGAAAWADLCRRLVPHTSGLGIAPEPGVAHPLAAGSAPFNSNAPGFSAAPGASPSAAWRH